MYIIKSTYVSQAFTVEKANENQVLNAKILNTTKLKIHKDLFLHQGLGFKNSQCMQENTS